MKVELVEDMIILRPETQFEAQYLCELRRTKVTLDWFDDRGEAKENLEYCGIHLKGVGDE